MLLDKLIRLLLCPHLLLLKLSLKVTPSVCVPTVVLPTTKKPVFETAAEMAETEEAPPRPRRRWWGRTGAPELDAATEAANWQRTFGDKTKPAPVKGPESDKSQGASA